MESEGEICNHEHLTISELNCFKGQEKGARGKRTGYGKGSSDSPFPLPPPHYFFCSSTTQLRFEDIKTMLIVTLWLISYLSAIHVNDPLLHTLMEADQILSKSKRKLPSSNSPERASEHLVEVSDNSSQSSLVKRESLGNSDSSDTRLPDNIKPVEEEETLQNRLSVEQIKEIPKFANYHPGEPNKVSHTLWYTIMADLGGGYRGSETSPADLWIVLLLVLH